jgi:hypothetical protein
LSVRDGSLARVSSSWCVFRSSFLPRFPEIELYL